MNSVRKAAVASTNSYDMSLRRELYKNKSSYEKHMIIIHIVVS